MTRPSGGDGLKCDGPPEADAPREQAETGVSLDERTFAPASTTEPATTAKRASGQQPVELRRTTRSTARLAVVQSIAGLGVDGD